MTPAKRAMPRMPKADPATAELFRSIVPDHPDVTVRPMFGQLAGFVNGNMFMGIYGADLFVRLPEEDRAAVAKAGGGPFEPIPGRPMKEYVVLPPSWRSAPGTLDEWVTRSLAWAERLPPKVRGTSKKRRRPD